MSVVELDQDLSPIETRIDKVLAVFSRLAHIQIKTDDIRMKVTVKPRAISQFLYEDRTNAEKLIFSITVDSSTKKIDVSINKNDSRLLRCEFRKKLHLIKNNIPDGVTIPFLNEFRQYVLN